MTATDEASFDDTLAEHVSRYYADPYGFVMAMYPWREPDTLLSHEDGPDGNQKDFLKDLGKEVKRRKFNGRDAVMPILMNETSGHGTGKSAMGGWLADWILSTRPFSRGTVTAGTNTQLESRTWAAIQYWTSLCYTSHWFNVAQTSIYHKNHRESWNVVAQTCRKENAQAFAGQHARASTSWYLLDEASGVEDPIWEVLYGGLTDGEPMVIAWGQCTKNTGEFYRVTHGKLKERWNTRRVDSRTSKFTNKALIQQWIEDYGIESDFVKVRVLGYAPSASELQYIDKLRVEEARKRVQRALFAEPIIAGFDVSGGGAAWNVIRFRQGLNGNILPAVRLPGGADKDPDYSQRVGICLELLRDERPGHKIAAMFVDAAFGAGIVGRVRQLGYTNVHEINFGGESPDVHQLNMRAYMYAKAKDWLLLGGLPDDDKLCEQLSIPGYHTNSSGKLVLESKQSITERGEVSPDDADAFVLTFARAVAAPDTSRPARQAQPKRAWS